MINVGIVGYGNLGKGVQYAIERCEDMNLFGIFTRRNPKDVNPVIATDVYNISDILNYKDKIDVLILCGGSATDLPVQTPELAKNFTTVDSFDTHAKIPEYFKAVDESAKAGNNISVISIGWDPGLFSVCRAYFEGILADGETATFWGKGVSQGHSDAIRRIEGVKKAIQYTIPIDSAVEAARNGKAGNLTAREKHLRECFVVLNDGADQNKIEKEIKEMPNYFADYDTIVHFIDEDEFMKNHSKMNHGGFVIRNGKTGKDDTKQVCELKLELGSNPEFTSSVLVGYARAAVKLKAEGKSGAFSILDIPPAYLSPKSAEQLRKELL